MIQLIGRKGNEEMLKTIPHHPIEDMEIVYRFHVQDTEMGQASALVTNSMLEHYGITAGQLQQDAFASAVSHKPFEIKTMAEVLNELMGAEIIPQDELPMYVVSNKERIHGCLLYTSCLKENTTRVRNMKQYLLAALYNAPLTISNYYSSRVNHDMANGRI